jgi:hypothetical protein
MKLLATERRSDKTFARSGAIAGSYVETVVILIDTAGTGIRIAMTEDRAIGEIVTGGGIATARVGTVIALTHGIVTNDKIRTFLYPPFFFFGEAGASPVSLSFVSERKEKQSMPCA